LISVEVNISAAMQLVKLPEMAAGQPVCLHPGKPGGIHVNFIFRDKQAGQL